MRRISVLVCLLFALSGCAGTAKPSEPPDGSTPVYYVTDWETNDQTDIVLAALYPVIGKNDPVNFCLAQLFLPPPEEEGLRLPYPPGARVMGCKVNEGIVTVELSSEFTEMQGSAKTLAAACLTLTLCALPDISGVRLVVDTIPWPSQEREVLTPSDFSLDEPVLKPVDKKLTLYFVDQETNTLVPEERTVILRETEPAERYVMEALLSGAREPELHSALPEAAHLLGVYLEGGTCYVDMSASFFEATPPYSHPLAVRAIVRSLTALPDVREVQFMQEGHIASMYGSIDLGFPLS